MTAVVTASALVGWGEFRRVVANGPWLAAFVVRVVSTVAFVTLLASATGANNAAFALFGNCFALIAIELSQIPPEMAKERFQGTLTLLVSSPAPLGLVFLIRYLPWLVMSTLVAVVAWAGAGAWGLITIDLRGAGELAVAAGTLLLTTAGMYAMTVVVGALALRRVAGRTIYSDLLAIVTLALCGLVAPLGALPPMLAWVAHALPLTNGLQALRLLSSGDQNPAAIGLMVSTQAAVSIAWIVVALLATRRLISRGLRDGSLNYS